MKKTIKLIIGLLLCLNIVACSNQSDNSKKDDVKEDKITTQEMSRDEIISELYEISNWQISDYWNDGLVDINWYLSNGTSATGGELNIEITLKNYNSAYAKTEEYSTFINSLSDEYTEVKDAWKYLYDEMIAIDEYIQNNEIAANSNLEWDTSLYVQARDYFTNSVNNLNE